MPDFFVALLLPIAPLLFLRPHLLAQLLALGKEHREQDEISDGPPSIDYNYDSPDDIKREKCDEIFNALGHERGFAYFGARGKVYEFDCSSKDFKVVANARQQYRLGYESDVGKCQFRPFDGEPEPENPGFRVSKKSKVHPFVPERSVAYEPLSGGSSSCDSAPAKFRKYKNLVKGHDEETKFHDGIPKGVAPELRFLWDPKSILVRIDKGKKPRPGIWRKKKFRHWYRLWYHPKDVTSSESEFDKEQTKKDPSEITADQRAAYEWLDKILHFTSKQCLILAFCLKIC